MTLRLELFVRGTPVPQGSHKAFVVGKRAVVVPDTRGGTLEDWRRAVAAEVRAGRPTLSGAVRVHAEFVHRRPASHYLPANSRRPVRVLRPDAPRWKTTKPDGDKELRAIGDSLKGVVYADDALVVDWRALKVWGDPNGVRLVVEELAEGASR